MAEKQENRQSALELIEYPSRFPLKVFGHHNPRFEDIVLELVRPVSYTHLTLPTILLV